MKRVVSIRIEAKTLAGVYDFLEHVCSYDTSHLPISTATQVAMEAIVEWFRRKGELPLYETDNDALSRIGKGGNYVAGAYLPNATERISPIPRSRGTKSKHIHRQISNVERTSHPIYEVSNEQVIEQNLNDNSSLPAQQVDPNVLKSKQEHMISLIDKFIAKEEDDEFNKMLAVVKETNIYKEEE